MSGKTSRVSVGERAKKRREYLRRKAAHGLFIALCGSVGVLTILVLLAWFRRDAPYFSGLAVFLAIVSVSLLALFFFCICFVAAKQSRSLPYVPPVREQVGGLPSDEVLLRGADFPTARSDELLRSAQTDQAMKPEELLRPDDRSGAQG